MKIVLIQIPNQMISRTFAICLALSACLCAAPGALARNESSKALRVSQFTLANGMTVLLNEDHSQPKVFGAVVVKAGSNDCPDTGIAHYFEHMMFKGTNHIGTTDYASEKVYLDSIVVEYDRLAAARDDAERTAIQSNINRLSRKAAEYAIPNEFDRLVSRFGGSGLNAYTSFDRTVYHNSFSPQFLSQWCELYTERLRCPVFRLFQSELETVYEEKNMYSDNPVQPAVEYVLKEYFGDTPYGTPIIGTTENLKNPQLSRMADFFEKFYVPRNMGLILTGDITLAEALPLIEKSFGTLKDRGEAPRKEIVLPPFEGQRSIDIKVPIPVVKFGGKAFRCPSKGDPDEIPLKVALELLSNRSASGLLDSLGNARKMLGAMAINDYLGAEGILLYGYVPNLPFGRLSKAETLCEQQIDRVRKGDFPDATLDELKRNLRSDLQRGYEDIAGRGSNMISAFVEGRTWEDCLADADRYSKVTRQDVMRVTSKYFGENYLKGTKKYGKQKKDKVSQPDYKPLSPANAQASSAYADSLMSIPVRFGEPRIVDFQHDVARTGIGEKSTLYSVKNPFNDIYELSLVFYKGWFEDPALNSLPDYLACVGTDSLSLQELNTAQRRLGSYITCSSDRHTFTFKLSGPEDRMEEALGLLDHYINHPVADKEGLKQLLSTLKIEESSMKKDNSSIASALQNYVLYGDKSSYLLRFNKKDFKKIGAEGLVDAFNALQDCEYDLVYNGVRTPDEVAALFGKHVRVRKAKIPRTYIPTPVKEYSEPLVYVYDMPSSRQNIIMTFQSFGPLSGDERTRGKLFGEYFGSGMFSVLFQEIREFRSMAYTASGGIILPERNRPELPGGCYSYMGTQSDKSVDALNVLDSLFRNMPVREANVESARLSLLNGINNSFPTFRRIGHYVRSMESIGYNEDPDALTAKELEGMGKDDILRFWNSAIKDKPRVLMIVGSKKTMPMDAMKKWGRIIELKYNDICR